MSSDSFIMQFQFYNKNYTNCCNFSSKDPFFYHYFDCCSQIQANVLWVIILEFFAFLVYFIYYLFQSIIKIRRNSNFFMREYIIFLIIGIVSLVDRIVEFFLSIECKHYNLYNAIMEIPLSLITISSFQFVIMLESKLNYLSQSRHFGNQVSIRRLRIIQLSFLCAFLVVDYFYYEIDILFSKLIQKDADLFKAITLFLDIFQFFLQFIILYYIQNAFRRGAQLSYEFSKDYYKKHRTKVTIYLLIFSISLIFRAFKAILEDTFEVDLGDLMKKSNNIIFQLYLMAFFTLLELIPLYFLQKVTSMLRKESINSNYYSLSLINSTALTLN